MKLQITILFLFHNMVSTLRILTVLPTATKSHYICGRRIIMELLKRGHEVVLISPFEEAGINLTWIEVEVKSFVEAVPTIKDDIEKSYNFFTYQNYIWKTMNSYTKYIINKPKLKRFMKYDNSQFDLVFVQDFFQPIFYTFANKYNASLVVLSTFGIANYINDYIENPQQLFLYPHEFTDISLPLNIGYKILNYIYTKYDIFGRNYYVLDTQNDWVQSSFNLKNVPHLRDLENNVSMVFVNSHWSMDDRRSYVGNIIQIGGVHIDEGKDLKHDLKEFLDGADDGAILFSFGYFLDLCLESKDFVSNILNVLGGLKQRVILKWNCDRNVNDYNNIYTSSWLPQNDILAHPNIKLFITHGGLLSNQEAIYHGVPIICVPFQASQPKVCRKSVEQGYATRVNKNDLPQKLNETIYNMLTNVYFKENVLEVSRKFRDRPQSPLNTAVYWMEYCLRHNIVFDRRNSTCPFRDVTVCLIVIYLLNMIGRKVNSKF